MRNFDAIVLGAGIYGLHTALYLAEKGKRVIVLEHDDTSFSRASFVNQARVHNGYHYPRSKTTATRSAHYFSRFCKEFDFAINKDYESIYAIAGHYSGTNSDQFMKFCRSINIDCDEIDGGKYFLETNISGAFSTIEYCFDARMIRDYLIERIKQTPLITVQYSVKNFQVLQNSTEYTLTTDYDSLTAPWVVNCTYASINQILKKFGQPLFPVKYEIAEVCLCNVSTKMEKLGITVMDGPFFSVIPFGNSGYHSLTSVAHTPHQTSFDDLPRFDCQKINHDCTREKLDNCNYCPAKPETAWGYMNQVAKKFLKPDLNMEFKSSIFAIKPVLRIAEIDDSRPTLISRSPEQRLISVLSGKINTIYDLEEILDEIS